MIERALEYVKARTEEAFDDYYPCRKKKGKTR